MPGAGYIGLEPSWKGLDVVGQRGQDMPAKAANCHHVVGVAAEALHHNNAFRWSTTGSRGGIRKRPDESTGAHLVAPASGPRQIHSKVPMAPTRVLTPGSQANSNVQLDGADTAVARKESGHASSRQLRSTVLPPWVTGLPTSRSWSDLLVVGSNTQHGQDSS